MIKGSNLRKTLQRSIYTFASTKWGALVLIVIAFITLNSLLHFLEAVVGVAIVNKTTLYHGTKCDFLVKQYSDNIVQQEFQSKLCYEPLDVVYTWVNGSDPRHKQLLALFTENPEAASKIQADLSALPSTSFSPADANATTSKQKEKDDSISGSNRFRDNDELKYSLRSLEKYAGWIRNVYIVTNGQVPSWLDIKNPKVKIVTHAEIWSNASHLPVFSSPAIEMHLHRIPGLSDKFIYLNDDVFFGNYVYPEDFYSKSTGQKVFLTWDVPDCAPGCSASWIGDGYCDLACNTTSCDYDGGDCFGVQASTSWSSSYGSTSSYSYGSWASTNSYSTGDSKKCAPRCLDNWVGDRFCDSPCNVKECGYDAGDCGVQEMKTNLPSYHLTQSTQHLTLKSGVPALYINLTSIYPPGSEITSGTQNNQVAVRTSTISQAHKILTLTIHKNVTGQDVKIELAGKVAGAEIKKEFTIRLANETEAVAGDIVGLESNGRTVVINPTSEKKETQTTSTTTNEKEKPAENAEAVPAPKKKKSLAEKLAELAKSREQQDHKLKKRQEFESQDDEEPTVTTEKEDKNTNSQTEEKSKEDDSSKEEEANHEQQTDEEDQQKAEEDKTSDENAENHDENETEKQNEVAQEQEQEEKTSEETTDEAKTETVATQPEQKNAGTEGNDDITRNLFDVIGENAENAEKDKKAADNAQKKPSKIDFEDEHKDDANKGTAQNIDSPHEDDEVGRAPQTPQKPQTKLKTNKATKKSEQESEDPLMDDLKLILQRFAEKQSGKKTKKQSESYTTYAVEKKPSTGRKLFSLIDEDEVEATAVPTANKVPDPQSRITLVKHDEKDVTYSTKHKVLEEQEKLELQNYHNAKFNQMLNDEIAENQRREDNPLLVEQAPTRRRLFDKFGDSLIHVNKLLNKRYGRVSRKVPAHMPHMIDKHIMQEAVERWPAEFNATSSNRFRSSNDMQYTFTYFYYMMHEAMPYNPYTFFEQKLDRNHDGALDDYEIRMLAVILNKHKISAARIKEIQNYPEFGYLYSTSGASASAAPSSSSQPEQTSAASSPITAALNTVTTLSGTRPTPSPSPSPNAEATGSAGSGETDTFWSRFQYGRGSSGSRHNEYDEFNKLVKAAKDQLYLAIRYSNQTQPNVDSFVMSGLSWLLGKSYKATNKYKYTLSNLDEVAFHMIGDDAGKVGDQLDDVRYRGHKFVCLNDDMNKTAPNPDVVEMLHNFYQWYFPTPSSFELPEGETNPYLYIDELKRHVQNRLSMKYATISIACIIALSVCISLCSCQGSSNGKSKGSSPILPLDQGSPRLGGDATSGKSSTTDISATARHRKVVEEGDNNV